MRPEEFELYDFVIAGYHFGTVGSNPLRSLALHGRNLLSAKRKVYSAALTRKNTDLVIRSLRKNKVRVLTHPGDKGAGPSIWTKWRRPARDGYADGDQQPPSRQLTVEEDPDRVQI